MTWLAREAALMPVRCMCRQRGNCTLREDSISAEFDDGGFCSKGEVCWNESVGFFETRGGEGPEVDAVRYCSLAALISRSAAPKPATETSAEAQKGRRASCLLFRGTGPISKSQVRNLPFLPRRLDGSWIAALTKTSAKVFSRPPRRPEGCRSPQAVTQPCPSS